MPSIGSKRSAPADRREDGDAIAVHHPMAVVVDDSAVDDREVDGVRFDLQPPKRIRERGSPREFEIDRHPCAASGPALGKRRVQPDLDPHDSDRLLMDSDVPEPWLASRESPGRLAPSASLDELGEKYHL